MRSLRGIRTGRRISHDFNTHAMEKLTRFARWLKLVQFLQPSSHRRTMAGHCNEGTQRSRHSSQQQVSYQHCSTSLDSDIYGNRRFQGEGFYGFVNSKGGGAENLISCHPLGVMGVSTLSPADKRCPRCTGHKQCEPAGDRLTDNGLPVTDHHDPYEYLASKVDKSSLYEYTYSCRSLKGEGGGASSGVVPSILPSKHYQMDLNNKVLLKNQLQQQQQLNLFPQCSFYGEESTHRVTGKSSSEEDQQEVRFKYHDPEPSQVNQTGSKPRKSTKENLPSLHSEVSSSALNQSSNQRGHNRVCFQRTEPSVSESECSKIEGNPHGSTSFANPSGKSQADHGLDLLSNHVMVINRHEESQN